MRHLMITLQVFTSCYALAAQKPYLVKCADNASKNCVVWTQGFTPKNVVCKVEGLNSYESIPGSDIKQEVIKVDRTGKEITLLDRALKFIGAKDLLENERLRCTVDTDKRAERIEAAKAKEDLAKEKEQERLSARKQAIDELKEDCKNATGREKKFCKAIEVLAGD